MLILATILAAASDQSQTATGDTSLGTEEGSDINAVLNMRVFTVKDVGPGTLNIPIPLVHVSFFSGLFDIMTWNYSYFSGTWSLLRIPLVALTFSVGLLMFISAGPGLVSVAEFFGRTVAGIAGGIGSGLRGLFSFFG